MNPKGSKAVIKPPNERHADAKKLIKEKMGSDLYDMVYQMIEMEMEEGTDAAERQQAVNEIC